MSTLNILNRNLKSHLKSKKKKKKISYQKNFDIRFGS